MPLISGIVLKRGYGQIMTAVGTPEREGWSTKKELADHLRFSTRWVEKKVAEGLPHGQFGSQKRFRISECETWLQERSTSSGNH